MPLMPVTRPLNIANSTTATPMIAPPASADHGVNAVQSMLTADPECQKRAARVRCKLYPRGLRAATGPVQCRCDACSGVTQCRERSPETRQGRYRVVGTYRRCRWRKDDE